MRANALRIAACSDASAAALALAAVELNDGAEGETISLPMSVCSSSRTKSTAPRPPWPS